MSSDLEAVAGGLSKAQREALVQGRWNVGDNVGVFLGRGLVKRIRSKKHPLLNLEITPLGLRVRAHLQTLTTKDQTNAAE